MGDMNSLVLLAKQAAAKTFQQSNICAFPWEGVSWAMGRVLRTSVSGDRKVRFLRFLVLRLLMEKAVGHYFPGTPNP